MAASVASAESAAQAAGPALVELETPFALIDGRRLRDNIATMQDAVASLGAALRPHFKTHRTLHIARMQYDAGAIGLTVATPRQLTTVTRELDCPVMV